MNLSNQGNTFYNPGQNINLQDKKTAKNTNSDPAKNDRISVEESYIEDIMNEDTEENSESSDDQSSSQDDNEFTQEYLRKLFLQNIFNFASKAPSLQQLKASNLVKVITKYIEQHEMDTKQKDLVTILLPPRVLDGSKILLSSNAALDISVTFMAASHLAEQKIRNVLDETKTSIKKRFRSNNFIFSVIGADVVTGEKSDDNNEESDRREKNKKSNHDHESSKQSNV